MRQLSFEKNTETTHMKAASILELQQIFPELCQNLLLLIFSYDYTHWLAWWMEWSTIQLVCKSLVYIDLTQACLNKRIIIIGGGRTLQKNVQLIELWYTLIYMENNAVHGATSQRFCNVELWHTVHLTLWLYKGDSKRGEDQCDSGSCQHDFSKLMWSIIFISTHKQLNKEPNSC